MARKPAGLIFRGNKEKEHLPRVVMTEKSITLAESRSAYREQDEALGRIEIRIVSAEESDAEDEEDAEAEAIVKSRLSGYL